MTQSSVYQPRGMRAGRREEGGTEGGQYRIVTQWAGLVGRLHLALRGAWLLTSDQKWSQNSSSCDSESPPLHHTYTYMYSTSYIHVHDGTYKCSIQYKRVN